MLRLNLFTELKQMERVLDERTELLVLRKHYRFYHTNPLVVALCLCNFWVLAGGRAPQNLSLYLAVIGAMGLLSVLFWPCYQLANGIYCLEISAQGAEVLWGSGYRAVTLAVECLAGGLLGMLIALGFVSELPFRQGLGLFLLGTGASYAVLCAAHNVYLHKTEEPGTPRAGSARANAAAAVLWAAMLAAGLWCLLPPSA